MHSSPARDRCVNQAKKHHQTEEAAPLRGQKPEHEISSLQRQPQEIEQTEGQRVEKQGLTGRGRIGVGVNLKWEPSKGSLCPSAPHAHPHPARFPLRGLRDLHLPHHTRSLTLAPSRSGLAKPSRDGTPPARARAKRAGRAGWAVVPKGRRAPHATNPAAAGDGLRGPGSTISVTQPTAGAWPEPRRPGRSGPTSSRSAEAGISLRYGVLGRLHRARLDYLAGGLGLEDSLQAGETG